MYYRIPLFILFIFTTPISSQTVQDSVIVIDAQKLKKTEQPTIELPTLETITRQAEEATKQKNIQDLEKTTKRITELEDRITRINEKIKAVDASIKKSDFLTAIDLATTKATQQTKLEIDREEATAELKIRKAELDALKALAEPSSR